MTRIESTPSHTHRAFIASRRCPLPFDDEVRPLVERGRTFDQYRLVEHPCVEQWWGRHWDIAERLLDHPARDHVRAYVFDAEDLAYDRAH